MHEDALEDNYHDQIRKHVISLLGQRPRSFSDLLQRSLNCDPALLLEKVQELLADSIAFAREVDDSGPKYILRSWGGEPDSTPHSKSPEHRMSNTPPLCSRVTDTLQSVLPKLLMALPEATPVYSQWWFSAGSYGRLLKNMVGLAERASRTAFLACSTLGALFSRVSDSHVAILDVDHVVLENLRDICARPTDMIPYDAVSAPAPSLQGSFQCVVADPPWSRSLLQLFLARSASLAAPGGKVVFSFPQDLTRPSMPYEKREFLRIARGVGLRRQEVIRGATEYHVPGFERSAYEAMGIRLNRPWRSGDWFVFTKAHDAAFPGMFSGPPLNQKWEQFTYDACRVFLKRDGQCEEGEPKIRPCSGMDGFVYKSTSSRSRTWESASLVTTRNRIAEAYGRAALSLLLKKLARTGVMRKPGSPEQCSPALMAVRTSLREVLSGDEIRG